MEMQGDGIMDFWGPRLDGFNNKSSKTIMKYGNQDIEELYLRRKPIFKFIQKVIDFATAGLSKEKHDKLFHLSLIAKLKDGTLIIMEKNEVVNIEVIKSMEQEGAEILKVPMKRPIKLFNFVNNARDKVGDLKFFQYDGLKNNCQWFVRYLLYYNALLNKENHDFLFQNLEHIIKNTAQWKQYLGNAVTNTAGFFNKIIGGKNDNEKTDEEKMMIVKYIYKDFVKFMNKGDTETNDYDYYERRIKKWLNKKNIKNKFYDI